MFIFIDASLQEKFIPSKSVKSHQSQPWITHGLKKQLKKKRKLYKTRNENLETLATYKKVRSQIQRQIRKAQWDHINAACCCCCCDNPFHQAALLGHHYKKNDKHLVLSID